MQEDARLIHCERLRASWDKNRDKRQEYRQSRREIDREYQKLYYAQQPKEVKRARYRLAYAIKKGRIIKPAKCEGCGAEGRVEGHHYKGYAEEFHLIVQWLCKLCHGKEGRGRAYRPRTDVVVEGWREPGPPIVIAEPEQPVEAEPEQVFDPLPPTSPVELLDEAMQRFKELYPHI